MTPVHPLALLVTADGLSGPNYAILTRDRVATTPAATTPKGSYGKAGGVMCADGR